MFFGQVRLEFSYVLATLLGHTGTAATSSANVVKVVPRIWMVTGAVRLVGCVVCSVPDAVLGVLRLGIPAQIYQTIIRRVAVVVAALHARRPWTDKGLQHQAMNLAHTSLSVDTQHHERVTT